MIKWKITKLALSNLERLLTCSLCKCLVQDPCTLEGCDHHFCRNCVEKLVGVENKCPECGAFAWSKDLKVNRRLADILSLCKSIRSSIGNDDYAAETATPIQETYEADVLLRPISTSTEDDKIAESNEIRQSAQDGDDILLKHSWNARKRRQELENNTDNNNNYKREEFDVHSEACCSQESETEDVNSSIELFSSNNSFCNENDLTQSETPSSNAHGEESDIITCTDDKDINASIGNHENNPEMSKICDSRPKPDTHVNTDIQEIVQVKGKKRKMSDTSDSEIDDIGTTSTLQEKVLMTERSTPDTEKTIHSQRDHEMESSSKKKRSKLVSSHKNTGKTNQLTPQRDSIRKKLITSPASVKSIMELSPAQLTKRNKRGEGLLHVAAIKGNDEDARCLLKKGANPNARDNAGWSPLHEACNHGYVSIAELLLDNGAIVNLPGGPEHETPLHDAVANGRLQVASLLMKRGASLHARNNQGLTPIDYAFTDPMKRLLEEEPSAQCQTWTNDKENILLQTNLEHHTAKVLLYTGLKTEQKEKLELCAAILGAKVVNEFSVDVTHIITSTNNSSLCRRTMKYLSGILCGKWIVSFGWITKCLSASKWVDENPFEVKGTSNAKSGIPHHARLNHLQQLPGLFDGCKFFFSGTFDPKTPIKEDLINLVNYGGGKVLTREPKQEIDYSPFIVQSKCHKDTIPASVISTVAYHAQPDSTQYRCTTYIIYDPLSQNKQSVRNVSGPSVAPVGWLLDCISNFEILDMPSVEDRCKI